MTILHTENLKKYYGIRSGIFGKRETLRAVDGVSIEVEADRVFAVVGESGCGKSTLARLLLHLTTPTGGRVFFKGKDIYTFGKEELKGFRRSVQVIFQDPLASLNPRMNVFSILSEPIRIHGTISRGNLRDYVSSLLDSVGLKPEHMNRYPHEFSGGQKQRICIARALSLSPELIVADEPLSSLDVSIQAQILNLLYELKENRRLSFVFISHDLNVVNYFADHVAVMYAGRIVEEAEVETIFNDPEHPYTATLLKAIPMVRQSERKGKGIYMGNVAGAIHGTTGDNGHPSGCPFYPRCHERLLVCKDESPPLQEKGGRKIACHIYS